MTHSIAVHGRYHPSYLGRCAIGWAILDKDDPTKIIAREHSRLALSESFAPLTHSNRSAHGRLD